MREGDYGNGPAPLPDVTTSCASPIVTCDEGDLKRLLEEVDVFQLASHLFWALWSCVNAVTSNIPFGYWVSLVNVL
jgi:hypothetical protein